MLVCQVSFMLNTDLLFSSVIYSYLSEQLISSFICKIMEGHFSSLSA